MINPDPSNNTSNECQHAQNEYEQPEATLQESEADFRAMFNLTSVGMAQVDAHTRCFLRANASFCKLTGYTEAEILTLTVDDINHPDDRDRDRQHFTNLLQGITTNSQSEKRYLRKDGSSVWVLATTNLIYDATGQPVRVMAIVQDITERKQIEVDLRNSEERFHFVTQAVNGLIFDWNLRTGETYRSERLYDIVGFRPEDVSPTANWWYERIHPDDLSRLEPQITALLSSSKQIYESEYRVRHKDGHWIDVWEQACLIRDEQGQVARIVGCTVDISEHKRFEAEREQLLQDLAIERAQFEAVLQQMPAGVIIGQASSGRLILGNQQAEQIWQHPFVNAEKIDEYTQYQGFHLDGRPNHPEDWPLARSLTKGEVVTQEEIRFLRGDGTEGVMEASSTPIYDQQGQITYGVVIFQDITNRKQIEEALKTSEERLRFAVEGAALGTWEYDLATSRIVWSEQAKVMFGVPLDAEVNYEMFITTLHPEDRDRIHTSVERAIAQQSIFDGEMRVVWQDASIHWIRSIGRARYSPDGTPTSMIGVTFDITERKQAEKALKESEEQLRLATEGAKLGMWFWDGATNTFTWTDRAKEMFGLPVNTEMSMQVFLGTIHPDDLSQVQNIIHDLETGQIHTESEYRIVWSDGTVRWILARGNCSYHSNGRLASTRGILMDITDRKRAEAALQESEAIARVRAEELETLMELVPVGIWLAHDPECQQITANRAAYELMRATPGAVASDSSNAVNYPIKFKLQRNGQDIPPEELSLQLAGRTGKEILEEAELVFEDGVVRHIYGRAVPLLNDVGNVRGVIGAYVDITERKQSEAALRNSERRFRRLVESNMFGVAFGDFNGGIQYVNDYFVNMVGYSREEFKTGEVRWIDITPPEYLHLDEKAEIELKTKGVAIPFEKEYVRKDGTRIPILIGSTLLQNSCNQQAEIISFYVDLSERKQIEEALRQALHKLNFHVENTPMAVIEWDRNMHVIRWSKTAEQIFGWQSSEMLGRALTDFNLVFEEDSQQVSEVIDRLMIGEEACVFLYSCNYTKQGNVIHCEWYNSSLRDQSGQMISVLSLILDVTDRKQAEAALRQSEERYRYLVEAVPQLVWTADAQGRNTYVNQQMCDYIGLSSEQLMDLNWQAVIHPDDVDRVNQRWMESVQTSIPYEVEYRLRRADGIYRWQLVRAKPFKDEQGQITQWFGTSIDIHDKQELEEQRLQLLQQSQAAREEAERANRIKDEFLAVLSHELRSPLNPILGWTRLLQGGKLNAARQAEALATIERNAKLQTQLIEDLLDISRIMQGKLTLTAAPVNLKYVISAAAETVRLAAEAKQIQILLDFNSEVVTVSGDAARLQQVVWNLLSNAIKFTPNGGRVEVQLEQVENEKINEWKYENEEELDYLVDSYTSTSVTSVSHAQITVKDTGKGISASFLPHVFEYFRQADATTTRKFGGLGLGLAIVRQIVEMHGGVVKAESLGENRGATFIVQLPLMQQFASPTSETSPSKVRTRELPLSNLQILVVDDNDDTREFQTFLLKQQGAMVTAVKSGVEALNKLDQFVPDLIVSDVGMANMDGYMLMQQIRARPANGGGQVPAIALTAYASDFDQQKAFQAGFQAHITKPLEPNKLIETIAQLFA